MDWTQEQTELKTALNNNLGTTYHLQHKRHHYWATTAGTALPQLIIIAYNNSDKGYFYSRFVALALVLQL